MLPKSRIFSALIIGLGIMLLAWGLLSPYFLHFDGRMPLDLRNTTFTLTDDKAKARIPQQDKVVTVPVSRQYHAQFMDPVDTNSVTARIGVTTMRVSNQDELDRLIDATVWSYRLDRFTGQALTEATMTDQPASSAKQVPIDALWVKFPVNAAQSTYQVFDVTLRKAVPATFQEELEINGRKVYRYRQDIEPTNVAMSYAGPFNTKKLEGEETGYLFHSGTRDYYVDQKSGLVVDIHEQIDDFYGTKTGEKKEQALLFDGQLSEESRSDMLTQAAQIDDGSLIRQLNWVAIGLGSLLTIAGLAGVFGLFARKP
ncbi:hypothetical protein CKALI_10265 [Corynebacterium kalinowskii]|uniref:DUF3068 domain-containing protein n=1 Tax=Corynebacterium kalinowskii TaxID=2675216 RepID=A0A6B8W6U0_9CORY|nr:DUF3068 domain-containing protein [Corynebacterium kalinowskii]QGU02908.1 hypothetical protein CKALI_10265 [Corynebacterium kalinowskii]